MHARRQSRRIGLVTAAATVVALLPATAGAQPQPRGIEQACPPEQIPDAGFEDTAGNTHEAAINCLAFYEITQGTTPTTYSPHATVRRDQMATFIARFLEVSGVDLPEEPVHAFADVPPDHVHALRINQLAELGVVGGFPDGTYRPADTVLRDQMAAFINRGIGHVTGAELAGDPVFTDTAGNPHEPHINGLASEGIVAGFGDGTYRPRDPVFRDQMASFIMRTVDLLAFTSFYLVVLDGLAEVEEGPQDTWQFGAGDPDGFGFAFLWLNSQTGRLCYDVTAVTDGPFTGNHIHEGRMNENGPVIIPLANPDAEGLVNECIDVDLALAAAIEADPSGYYVNVHTEAYPAGAIRGQLGVDTMVSYLSWAFEVDDGGPDDFSFGQGEEGADGIGLLQVDVDHGEVCVYVTTTASPVYTGFHIHEGAMYENGPIVVGFEPPHDDTGETSDCVAADPALLQDIVDDRDNYYLNVHNTQHPAGAVRSQIDAGALVVELTGEKVVVDGEAGRGEPGATGTLYAQTSFETGFHCQWLVVNATPPFTAAHIHTGAPDEAGPPVLQFTPPDDETGEVSECVDIGLDQLHEIAFEAEHYFQVHTADYPDGAVRGQLSDGIPF
jgi:hypothetical protein